MLKLSHFVTVDTPDGRWGVFSTLLAIAFLFIGLAFGATMQLNLWSIVFLSLAGICFCIAIWFVFYSRNRVARKTRERNDNEREARQTAEMKAQETQLTIINEIRTVGEKIDRLADELVRGRIIWRGVSRRRR